MSDASPLRRERPGPVRGPGLAHGRGADARLHERRGAAADPRDRRGPLLQPLARASCGARARPRATSMRVRQLRYDCDGDALVALVEPAGPACHTGERSCFYRDLEARRPRRRPPARRARPAPRGAAGARAHARRARRASGPRAPTRSSCSPIPQRIGDKVREEADEVARAAAGESDERRRRGGRRPPLPPRGAAALARARRWRRRWRCSMSRRRLSSAAGAIEPDLERARELARRGERDPGLATGSSTTARRRSRRSSSCARRSTGPAFLLESAEQGRLGRYSFLGFRPRLELRWADGELTEVARRRAGQERPVADPYGAVAERLAGFAVAEPERCRRSPAARSASSATTSCARSSRSASRTPTRSACPTWR